MDEFIYWPNPYLHLSTTCNRVILSWTIEFEWKNAPYVTVIAKRISVSNTLSMLRRDSCTCIITATITNQQEIQELQVLDVWAALPCNPKRDWTPLRATSHTRLRARYHYTSSTLIGGKCGAGGPRSLPSHYAWGTNGVWMLDGCKVVSPKPPPLLAS